MHKSSLIRMEWFADKYLDNKGVLKVLDIGSYDVNGSYREIFTSRGHNYTGLDMEEGPNVDICPTSTYVWEEISNDTYDIVISGQAIEHIEFFWITIGEIVRVTKKEGIICLIAPNGFDEHRYPVDCWRFFTDGMVAIARFYGLEILHAHTNAGCEVENPIWFSENCADSMLIAKKVYEGDANIVDLKSYKCVPAVHSLLREGMSTFEEHKTHVEENKGEKNKQESTLVEISTSKLRKLIKKIKNKVTI